MEALEKLEIIIRHKRMRKTREVDLGEDGLSVVYIQYLRNQVDNLGWVLGQIDMIKGDLRILQPMIKNMVEELGIEKV